MASDKLNYLASSQMSCNMKANETKDTLQGRLISLPASLHGCQMEGQRVFQVSEMKKRKQYLRKKGNYRCSLSCYCHFLFIWMDTYVAIDDTYTCFYVFLSVLITKK